MSIREIYPYRVESSQVDALAFHPRDELTPSSPPPPGVDELELMHKFATETYRSLCVSEPEKVTWQNLVPKLAFKHRYLMHGILSLASLYIATTLDPSHGRHYVGTGLEYHNMSLEPFRMAIDL